MPAPFPLSPMLPTICRPYPAQAWGWWSHGPGCAWRVPTSVETGTWVWGSRPLMKCEWIEVPEYLHGHWAVATQSHTSTCLDSRHYWAFSPALLLHYPLETAEIAVQGWLLLSRAGGLTHTRHGHFPSASTLLVLLSPFIKDLCPHLMSRSTDPGVFSLHLVPSLWTWHPEL